MLQRIPSKFIKNMEKYKKIYNDNMHSNIVKSTMLKIRYEYIMRKWKNCNLQHLSVLIFFSHLGDYQ